MATSTDDFSCRRDRTAAVSGAFAAAGYRRMQIGMRREAHYVKYYRGNSALNHEWCDKYLYAILQEDYIEMKK